MSGIPGLHRRAGNHHRTGGVMDRRVFLSTLAGGLLTAPLAAMAQQGCSVSPAEQDAIRRAWEERDAERAAECRRAGRGFVAGGCSGPGGP